MDRLFKYKIDKKYGNLGVKRLCIIFMGLSGAGKSSTINSFASIHSKKFEIKQNVDDGPVLLTTTLKAVDIFTREAAITTLDTAGIEFDFEKGTEIIGLETSNYGKDLLKYLIKG
jgi:putative ribosome biogenesis GTPase RsgA